MARININEIDKFTTGLSGEFFNLKNDKDAKIVHIIAETPDDIDAYVIHKVQVDGKQKNIGCLRGAGDAVADCPLCAAGYKQDVRLFLQLYDTEDNTVKIWDRGKSILKDVETFFRRSNPLYSIPAEIIRSGGSRGQENNLHYLPCN